MQQAVIVRSCSALLLLALAACDPSPTSGTDAGPPAPPTATSLADVPGYDPQWRPLPSATATSRADVDPLGGSITLEQATRGLPGSGPLVAEIDTSMGSLRCTLMPDEAPRTVAQFVGLANGTRPYRSRRGWVEEPAYDGSRIHRVVAGSLVVGGRPMDAHPDGIGLVTVPEPWEGMSPEQPGALCSAGRGRVGAGELLLTGSKPDLPASPAAGPPEPTVFGRCRPIDLVDRMSRVPSARGRPLEAIVIRKIRVRREGHAGTPEKSGK